MASAH
jgi:hypothetical protein